jgi:hypothetical protein
MSRIVSARPSPAMAVALAALFVALSGSAFAVKKLEKVGRNDIKSVHVKNGALKSKDLRNGKGVKGADVKNDSLGGAQIAESSLGQVPAAATAGNGLKAAFEYDDGSIVNPVGGPFTVDNNGDGTEKISFPFNVGNGKFHVVAGSGGASDLGGTVGCVVAVESHFTDADTLEFVLTNDDGNPCNEEFTVLVF